MKTLIRIFTVFAAVVFVLVTVIKLVRGCSYKEAVGIAEELCKEIIDSCCICNSGRYAEEESTKETEATCIPYKSKKEVVIFCSIKISVNKLQYFHNSFGCFISALQNNLFACSAGFLHIYDVFTFCL